MIDTSVWQGDEILSDIHDHKHTLKKDNILFWPAPCRCCHKLLRSRIINNVIAAQRYVDLFIIKAIMSLSNAPFAQNYNIKQTMVTNYSSKCSYEDWIYHDIFVNMLLNYILLHCHSHYLRLLRTFLTVLYLCFVNKDKQNSSQEKTNWKVIIILLISTHNVSSDTSSTFKNTTFNILSQFS